MSSRTGSRTSRSGTLSTLEKSGSTGKDVRSLCLELSLEYTDMAHPIFVEAQACYPVTTSERVLRRRLEDFLLDLLTDMFGLQALMLISNSGVFYKDGVDDRYRVAWSHGRGDRKTQQGEVELTW